MLPFILLVFGLTLFIMVLSLIIGPNRVSDIFLVGPLILIFAIPSILLCLIILSSIINLMIYCLNELYYKFLFI